MNPSEPTLIGHVNCSKGLSLSSFFAATLDALSKQTRQDASEILHNIERCWHDILGTPNSDSLEVSISQNLGILVLDVSQGDQQEWGLTQVKSLLSAASAQENFSSSIAKRCLKIFQYHKAAAETSLTNEDASEQSYGTDTLCFTIGIVYCIHHLGISRLENTPIPCGGTKIDDPISIAVSTELLKGSKVTFAGVGHDGPPDSVAIAILKVFSGVRPALSERDDGDFTLLATGTGKGIHSSAMIFMVAKTAVKDEPLWLTDTVTHFESNLDDMPGEDLAYAIELLLKSGAVDAWVSPIVMKKGRPAHTLHCLCAGGETRENELLELIFRHTTTLGIRMYRNLPRAKLCRSMWIGQTLYNDTEREGKVQVKVSSFQTGEIVSMKAEFDHCREISSELKVPIKLVARQAVEDVQRQVNERSKDTVPR